MVAEGLLIILSVLLAFGIDAWWGARQQAEEQLSLLDELEAEFRANLAELDGSEATHAMFARSAHRLLDISAGGQPLPSMVTLDSVLHHVFLAARTFNASAGALRAAQAADGTAPSFGLELRTTLGAWSGLLEDNAEDELRVVEYLDQQLSPFLSSHVPFVDAFEAAGPAMAQAYGSFSGSPGSTDHRILLASRQFQNHVVIRAAHEQLVLREHGRLRETAARVVDLIQREKEQHYLAGG